MLSVRLTPRSQCDGLEGVARLADSRLVAKARVRAPAEDGKANDALLKLIAECVGLPVSRITLAAGPAARVKKIYCHGEATSIARALEKALGLAPTEQAADPVLDARVPAGPIERRRGGGRIR